MKKKYFGTDGIRGPYKKGFIDENLAFCLGLAIGDFLQHKNSNQGCVLLGRDTRPSGDKLQAACSAGLQNHGLKALDAGVIPTPALAYGVQHLSAQMGVMVTASHNPASDNGLKLFSQTGSKLSVLEETEIEKMIHLRMQAGQKPNLVTVEQVGIRELYISFLKTFFCQNSLNDMRIVLDTANGATAKTSPEIFSYLGAEIIAINQGNGTINFESGSEHPQNLQNLVLENSATLGIAHDGDGDRVIFVDANGKVIDGDKILGLLAIEADRMGKLNQKGFVATIHSNSGLDKALATKGINLQRASVGDRNVATMMNKLGCNWGGESSGHIIAKDYLPTGDGLFSAAFIASAVKKNSKSIEELTDWIKLRPSKSVSIDVREKIPLEENIEVQSQLKEAQQRLRERGRILLRYSGTEPKIRLLVESEDSSLLEKIFIDMKTFLEKTL